jgi:ADP-heptose:LPS heptosyltransferase
VNRLLVVRRGGLGDTLLLAPVLQALARREPGTPIDVAGVREFATLLERTGAVARVRSSEDLGTFRLGHDPVARTRLAAEYSAVVADEPTFSLLADHGCRVQVFDPRPRPGVSMPLAQQIAAQLGLELRWPEDAWFAPTHRGHGRNQTMVAGPLDAQGKVPSRAVVVLAPGSGGRAKCWPRDHWLRLATELARAAAIEVVVGPTELERDDPRAWVWPVPVGFVVEAEPAGLAVRLEGAVAFVGNDSGPTHLAAMLAVPTVALFGPSDAVVFAPQGPRAVVLLAPRGELAALAPAVVLAAVADVQGR